MIQSALFDKNKFTKKQAIKKLIERGLKNNKIDVTDHYYRFRQYNPKPNEKYRTISAGEGIKYIYKI